MKLSRKQKQSFYDLNLGDLTLNVLSDGELQLKSCQEQMNWNLTTELNGN